VVAAAGPHAPGATGFGGPQPFDVLKYVLDVRLAMADENLGGQMVITMVLRSNVDSIVLNEALLTLDTVKVDGVVRDFTVDTPSETFTIDLGGTRYEGDTLRIEIHYWRDPAVTRPSDRQGYYFFDKSVGIPANLGYTMAEPYDARFWMPCFDEPWEKATAEISVTVPEGYVAASNGVLLGIVDNGDATKTWRWQEENQIAAYLMAVTVSEWTVSTLPYAPAGRDTIPLQYYAWAEDSAECAEYLPTVGQMMVALEELFGPYPFEKYGMAVVIPFRFLGMEHQSITTMNRLRMTSERIVVHELAHQWWGDLVTCGTWKDIWLNESFATYSEALWQEWLGGTEALQDYMVSLERFNMGSWEGAIYDPLGQGFPLFASSVYDKGAWVLHALRGVIGDSLFFDVLDAYRDRYAGTSVVTAEFQLVVDSITGREMDWFFDQWIFGPGWPRYAHTSHWSNDTLFLTIYQLQDAGWPTYRMPIDVLVEGQSADTMVTVGDSLRTQTFAIPLDFSPSSVTLDPDLWILKQEASPPVVDGERVPLTFRLEQNFPNPFNPATTIRYSLPEGQYVVLKVFDLLGREISTLVDQPQGPGHYAVEFDAADLAAGIYIYRILTRSTDGQTRSGHEESAKMLLLR
ncbi:MAG: M1 family aminopeptidase, partial [Bacteroidota bacterium]